MKTLIHATLRCNLKSIRRNGLLCSRSRGERLAVWLAQPDNERYVISHMLSKHAASLDEVVIIRVRVPEGTLRKHGRHGLLYSIQDIPVDAIIGVKGFVPVEESTW